MDAFREDAKELKTDVSLNLTIDGDEIFKGRMHYGEWHHQCLPGCTPEDCFCGACTLTREEDCLCSYQGSKGHWTCCHNEMQNSNCDSDHIGFYHLKCEDKCNQYECMCFACVDSCAYTGDEAHWSCCLESDFLSECHGKVKPQPLKEVSPSKCYLF